MDSGWTTEVEQSDYGHEARKRTWLYAVDCDLPALEWRNKRGERVVGAGIHRGECAGRRMVGDAARTPLAFRDVLLDMARSAAP